MKAKLLNFGERLLATYWFLPALMVVLAIGLAFAFVELDRGIPYRVDRPGGLPRWLYAGDPEAARSLLATVAGSTITVVSITFSITMVALSQASSQFGSLLLSDFMSDRANQLSLGTFIATFMYCLLVLGMSRGSGGEGEGFVPHLSVALAVLLAAVNVGVLIFFIHHASASLQAENIVASVAGKLNRSIRRLFPDRAVSAAPERGRRGAEGPPAGFERDGRPVAADRSGYLQTIDYERLVRIASERDLLLRLDGRPGDFIVRGSPLLRVLPAGDWDERLSGRIADALVLGPQRLPRQDVELAVHQLVELAVRALSPGINDPFTAVACVDRLGESLADLAERAMPSGRYHDGRGRLRLLARTVTFAGIVDSAFNQIRQYGRADAAVTVRLLETIAVIAGHTHSGERRAALLGQAEAIRHGAMEALPEERDRRDVESRYRRLLPLLERE